MNLAGFVPPPPDFYRVDALALASRLLGCVLVQRGPVGRQDEVALQITETEAYLPRDPASHSARGRTARNTPMFATGGSWYVYLSYGIHRLVNVVSGAAESGQAVLIRAGLVLGGADSVSRRLGRVPANGCVDGPGLVGRALGMDNLAWSGRRIRGGAADRETLAVLYRPPSTGPRHDGYTRSGQLAGNGPRVGISRAVERPWRYWLGEAPPSGSSKPRRRSKSSAEK